VNTQHNRKLHLQVVADLICPWCFIGKRTLDQALKILAKQGVEVDIDWLPYQLNPAMPTEGMDRKEFRSVRFGSWENALTMDARAVEAGRTRGAEIDYQLQMRTPNTMAAHALVRLARAEGGAALQDKVVDALFAGYFSHGQDIGNHAVLERIAGNAGMRSGAVQRSLEGQEEVWQREEAIRATGVTGVPTYLVEGKLLLTGSQEVDGYVQRLARASVVS
jgi:predicted DsbA family dithiol-disulfide isomerase